MKTLGDLFVAQVHSDHLKPLGFKKLRHTFVRFHDRYAEYYQIRGSAWSDRIRPWIFYLNCEERAWSAMSAYEFPVALQSSKPPA